MTDFIDVFSQIIGSSYFRFLLLVSFVSFVISTIFRIFSSLIFDRPSDFYFVDFFCCIGRWLKKFFIYLINLFINYFCDCSDSSSDQEFMEEVSGDE